jgi:hypothetical protein
MVRSVVEDVNSEAGENLPKSKIIRLVSGSHRLLYKPKVVSIGSVEILNGYCIKEEVCNHFSHPLPA